MPARSEASLLLVDDDAALLSDLKAWLSLHQYRVRTATGGAMAIAMLDEELAHVVITDLRMPGMGGLDLLDHIKQHHPDLPVLILSGQATLDDAIAALRQGRAFDMLKKPMANLDDLLASIDAALLARKANPASEWAAESLPPDLKLTPRELEILQLLQQGLSNRDIADRLCLSDKTVRNILSQIFKKLGVDNRVQAILLLQGRSLSPS